MKLCAEQDLRDPHICAKARDFIFGSVAIDVLRAQDQQLQGADKAKAGALAIKLAAPGK